MSNEWKTLHGNVWMLGALALLGLAACNPADQPAPGDSPMPSPTPLTEISAVQPDVTIPAASEDVPMPSPTPVTQAPTSQPASAPVAAAPGAGQLAPEFTLTATDGTTVSLASFRGQQAVVVYFYPKDMTPGCTKEACDFRDAEADFRAAGVAVLGVSSDSIDSHQQFTTEQQLNFPLLADTDQTVRKAFAQAATDAGISPAPGIRATYLIDKEGRFARVWPQVKVDGHVQEVMEAAKQLAG